MSGEQFITQVRVHRAFDTIPIMVLSARADDALRIRLLREGTQEYLVKPFFPEELLARIANLIVMKQARHVLQQEVFVPYSRIDAGTTRYIKGTGLGLSISRQIIQMHGGHIWAESSLGQGSRFHFTVPL